MKKPTLEEPRGSYPHLGKAKKDDAAGVAISNEGNQQ